MINKEKKQTKKNKPTDTSAVRVTEHVQIVEKESGKKLINTRG